MSFKREKNIIFGGGKHGYRFTVIFFYLEILMTAVGALVSNQVGQRSKQ
jgi:hypothetical protein